MSDSVRDTEDMSYLKTVTNLTKEERRLVRKLIRSRVDIFEEYVYFICMLGVEEIGGH